MSFSTLIATNVLRLNLGAGDIYGNDVPTEAAPAVPSVAFDDLPHNDPHEISRAAIITICASGCSILIACPGIYWFLRMRRRFRHDLIALLIASNLNRSFWHILFPIVEYFKQGLFPTESAFCQASGFMLMFGSEQADMAILLIAVHSALSVWGKRAAHQQGGLYPYRYYAYAFWFLIPVLLASLAFTNPDTIGYTNQGSVCYLPSRPYRYINLAWVPRYFVALSIFAVYIGIYFYATHKSHQYQREIIGLSRIQSYDKLGWIAKIKGWFRKGNPEQQELQRQNIMAAKDMLNFNRGLALSRSGFPSHAPYAGRMHPMDSSLVLDTSGVPSSKHHPRLPDGGFGFPLYELQDLARTASRSERPALEDKDSEGKKTSQEDRSSSRGASEGNDLESEPTRSTTTTTNTTSATDASTSAAHDFALGATGTARELEAPQIHFQKNPDNRRTLPGTIIPITAIRRPESIQSRRRSSLASLPESLASTSSLTPSLSSSIMSKSDTRNDVPKMVASSNIIAQHERMRRQLRYLFMYPFTYILLWIAPFVSHIIRNQQNYYDNPSFVLGVFVIMSISIQAGVDTIVFSWIERPWRHIPGSDGSFLGSFKCLKIRKNRRRGSVVDSNDVRERLARQLRDLEILDQRTLERDLSRPRIARSRSSSRPQAERYWWEQFEDYDDDDGVSRRRRSTMRNRRGSWVDYAVKDEEHRVRERRRRVSFPDEFGRELERVVEPPRRGSFPDDNGSIRSRSSHASTSRKRSGQEDDWHTEDKVTPQPPGEVETEIEREADEDGQFHDVSLDDEGNVEEGSNVEDGVLPPEPIIVETDDHG